MNGDRRIASTIGCVRRSLLCVVDGRFISLMNIAARRVDAWLAARDEAGVAVADEDDGQHIDGLRIKRVEGGQNEALILPSEIAREGDRRFGRTTYQQDAEICPQLGRAARPV